MLVVYVAHPIGGDVLNNARKVEERCGRIFQERPEVIPFAPYLMAIKFLNDDDPNERLRGVSMNKEFFFRKAIDEVWLYGQRISNGMWEEVLWARKLGIPVIPMSHGLTRELALRELEAGSIVRIASDGPAGGGWNPPRARLLSIDREEGVEVRLRSVSGLLLKHHLPWIDIAHISPYGAPIWSPKREEQAPAAS